MMETNIRVVQQGTSLYIHTRFARVSSQDDSLGFLQRACNALRGRGFAAVPAPSGENELLVAAHEPVPFIVIEEENWRADITDAVS